MRCGFWRLATTSCFVVALSINLLSFWLKETLF